MRPPGWDITGAAKGIGMGRGIGRGIGVTSGISSPRLPTFQGLTRVFPASWQTTLSAERSRLSRSATFVESSCVRRGATWAEAARGTARISRATRRLGTYPPWRRGRYGEGCWFRGKGCRTPPPGYNLPVDRGTLSPLLLLVVVGFGCGPAAPPQQTTRAGPADSLIPAGRLGDAIRRGRALLVATRDSLPGHVGNGLRCASCHLDEGRRPTGSLVGVYSRY